MNLDVEDFDGSQSTVKYSDEFASPGKYYKKIMNIDQKETTKRSSEIDSDTDSENIKEF